jgi:hypothetical protein
MNTLPALAVLTGFYPLARAVLANRTTTLRPALAWAAAALAAWVATPLDPASVAVPYLALCLSGCAGVAVLGARRPGVGAWNFVVGGLLAVQMLPVASGLGTPRLEPAHIIFLGATLVVVLLNYLPTRTGAAVPLAGAAFAAELARLAGARIPDGARVAGWLLLAAAPWTVTAALRWGAPANATDRLWIGFRDCYGVLWAQRVREQFNRSAASVGLPVRLAWPGLRPAGSDDGEPLATLRALLKRFATTPEDGGDGR